MRRLALFIALLAVCVGVALATPQPTCLLTHLELLTNDNEQLVFRDSDGQGYNADSTTYFCNCDNTIDTVRVLIKSDQTTESNTMYNLAFTNGNNEQYEEYIYNNQASSPLNFKPILNKIQVYAWNGSKCMRKITIHCTQEPDDGEAIGDPQFAGLRGQDYQVHGVSGEVYNIITDQDLQMNSKFVFLEQGQCPTFSGERAMGCWSHPGSYLGEIGIKTVAGDRIKLVSGDYKTGFASVELNGQIMEPGMTATLPSLDGAQGFVTFNHSFVVTVQAGNFLLQFENSDLFINQRVRVLDWSKLASHGLLGQTWRTAEYKNAIKYVEGSPDDYVVANKDLFGDTFVFNLFPGTRGDGAAVPRLIDEQEQMAQNQMVEAAEGNAAPPADEFSSSPSLPIPTPELIAEIVNEGSSFVSSLVSGVSQTIESSMMGGDEDSEGPSALEQAIPPSDDPDVLVAEIKEGAYTPDPIEATAAGRGSGLGRKRQPIIAVQTEEQQEEEEQEEQGNIPHNGQSEEESYVLYGEIKEGAYTPDPIEATAAGRNQQQQVSVEIPAAGEQPMFGVVEQEVNNAEEQMPPPSHHGRKHRRGGRSPRTVVLTEDI